MSRRLALNEARDQHATIVLRRRTVPRGLSHLEQKRLDTSRRRSGMNRHVTSLPLVMNHRGTIRRRAVIHHRAVIRHPAVIHRRGAIRHHVRNRPGLINPIGLPLEATRATTLDAAVK